ncbi:hypothetical protein [Pseudomonas coleopterorum]|uniref:hypothetical protein n=1 Tax=Pseudomonas coleopterorum TaxID=1605838 RepID=UPI00177E6F48|nr:hypothetical protein [Pseudomonas coleopterorum]MBD8483918.1 hypothetical protein [Pseudomonas coleopterorum]
MKIKFAAFALMTYFFSGAATAQAGIDMVLLNDNPNPAVDDRLAFQVKTGQQCRYYGIVKTPTLAVINRYKCHEEFGNTTPITMLVPLNEVTTSESGAKWYKAYEQGPKPLAISFMTQFYNVPAEAVKVEVRNLTDLDATVEAEAAGHFCEFEAAKLPEGSAAKYGWAAASMRCGK